MQANPSAIQANRSVPCTQVSLNNAQVCPFTVSSQMVMGFACFGDFVSFQSFRAVVSFWWFRSFQWFQLLVHAPDKSPIYQNI